MSPSRRGSGTGGPDGPRPAGFSLVEILVALVVLELGLLGVVGLSVLAQRRMAEAAARVRAVGAAEALADSLLRARPESPGTGEAAVGVFRLRWTRDQDGVRVEVVPSDGGGGPAIYVLDASPGAEEAP